MVYISKKIEAFLNENSNRSIGELLALFSEKSFAIIFLILMSIPALPLPTGGITHIFELITMLLAIELIVGRKTVWLPNRWKNLNLPFIKGSKTQSKLISFIQFVEKRSKPRFKSIQSNKIYLRLVGVIVFVFALFAFLAPPFSGLDTLPSLGIVLLSFGLLLEDSILSIGGFIIGGVGIFSVLLIGSLVFKLV